MIRALIVLFSGLLDKFDGLKQNLEIASLELVYPIECFAEELLGFCARFILARIFHFFVVFALHLQNE